MHTMEGIYQKLLEINNKLNEVCGCEWDYELNVPGGGSLGTPFEYIAYLENTCTDLVTCDSDDDGRTSYRGFRF